MNIGMRSGLFAHSNNVIGPRDGPLLRPMRPGPARRDRMQERAAERERETRMRENEDMRIQRIRDEMTIVEASEMDSELRNQTLRGLSQQIAHIFEQRAEREQTAVERELMRQQQEMEERMRERERQAKENAPEHDCPDEAAQRATIKSLTTMSARMDNISNLSLTRATLAAEAEQLRQDISNTMSHQQTGLDNTIWTQSSHAQTQGWKSRHLGDLNMSTTRLTMTINREVAAMYRDSQSLQEEQLRINGTRRAEPLEDDEVRPDEEQTQAEVDVRL